MARGAGRSRSLGLTLALVAAFVCAGCIGTVERPEFVAEIDQRGGGYTSRLVPRAIEAVTSELGVEDIQVRAIDINGPDQNVALEVRDPRAPDNLDVYRVARGEVETVSAVRVDDPSSLDGITFSASEVAFDQLEAMVDAALAEFGEADARVTTVAVRRRQSEDPVVLMSLDAPRARGTVQFSAAGELLGVSR